MQLEKIVETEHGFVDPETGEVISSSFTNTKHIIKKKTTFDNFVQVYIRDLADIYRITSRTQIALLMVLCEESKMILSNSDILPTFTALIDDKQRWAEKLQINAGKNVDNALAELVKKNIVLRISRGKYSLNPKYIFSGALKDRPKMLELCVKYEISESV